MTVPAMAKSHVHPALNLQVRHDEASAWNAAGDEGAEGDELGADRVRLHGGYIQRRSTLRKFFFLSCLFRLLFTRFHHLSDVLFALLVGKLIPAQ